MATVVLLDTGLHNRKEFACGEPELDNYLQRTANQDVRKRVAICYVLPDAENPETIVGYYTISNLGVQLSDLPDKLKRRLPRYPIIPATLLGRLAVAKKFGGKGFGEYLLMDALERMYELSREVGSALIVVDLLNASAGAFYEKYGFFRLPSQTSQMFMSMETVKKLFD